MPSTVQPLYGSVQNITITLANLADAAARQSVSVDNAVNLFLDAMVSIAIQLAAGAPAGDKKIEVYAYGSVDGSTFTDNASGSDAAITLRVPTNLQLLGTIECPDAGGLTYKGIFPSVATAFNGLLPYKWGIVIVNRTGLAFAATGHTTQYRGINAINA